MRKVLIYHPHHAHAIQLEYFCRGAAAADSNKLDWSFDSRANRLSVFVADEHVENHLRILFGEPAEVQPYTGHLA